jgi:DNA-binding IclR family transcriptional regulator
VGGGAVPQPQSQTQAAPSAAGKALSRADRETTLTTLSQAGWLSHHAATGIYHIGVRSFLELPTYLHTSLDPSDAVKQFWGLS